MVIIVFGIISSSLKYYEKGIFDLNELSMNFSWGFLFIFFSKEKTDDEMIESLKFKALTWSIFVTFSFASIYNYLFLNWRYEREHDRTFPISAYLFFASMLIIATARFYYLKRQATLIEEE
ncbi:MAG: hypothetical protein ACR2KZ_04470 [Segetibacter sp.]